MFETPKKYINQSIQQPSTPKKENLNHLKLKLRGY